MNRFHRREAEMHAKGYRVLADGTCLNPNGRALLGFVSSDGYVAISTSSGKVRLHRLHAFQLFGDVLFRVGTQVRHLDGNRMNNSAANLAIGTHEDNMQDKPAEVRMRAAIKATSLRPVQHPHVDIIEFFELTRSYTKTMERFGIKSTGTLHFILKKSRTVTHKRAA